MAKVKNFKIGDILSPIANRRNSNYIQLKNIISVKVIETGTGWTNKPYVICKIHKKKGNVNDSSGWDTVTITNNQRIKLYQDALIKFKSDESGLYKIY